MSRSKHTDPRAIRAARRGRAPFDGRGAGDLSLRRKRGQERKESDVIAPRSSAAARPSWKPPRIIVRAPGDGFHHPIDKARVLDLLKRVGPLSRYGLRSIELAQGPRGKASAAFVFGRYEAPGRILLFAQPLPPWRLPGRLRVNDVRQLQEAGAVVTSSPSAATLVNWPGDTLPRFMLEKVLLHEIGHHVLQQNEGKRRVRIARTSDHEAFAARFAARQRRALGRDRAPS